MRKNREKEERAEKIERGDTEDEPSKEETRSSTELKKNKDELAGWLAA